MKIFQQFQGFDWDDANKDKNWNRHNVAWWECEEVFFNQPLYVHKDERHSLNEERYYALGSTHNSRLIFIVFTRRKSRIRVILARDMHKKERKVYFEKAKRDSKV
jgi:uncharacterized protein